MDSPLLTLVFVSLGVLFAQGAPPTQKLPPLPSPASSPSPSPSSPRPRPPPPPQPQRRSPPLMTRKSPSPPPPVSKKSFNLGKKIGLVFSGVVVIMQVGVVAFLVIKRRELLKNNHRY